MRKSFALVLFSRKYELPKIILRALDLKKISLACLGKLHTACTDPTDAIRVASGERNSRYHQENYVYKERESLITPSRNVTPISNNIRDVFSERGGSISPSRDSAGI